MTGALRAELLAMGEGKCDLYQEAGGAAAGARGGRPENRERRGLFPRQKHGH